MVVGVMMHLQSPLARKWSELAGNVFCNDSKLLWSAMVSSFIVVESSNASWKSFVSFEAERCEKLPSVSRFPMMKMAAIRWAISDFWFPHFVLDEVEVMFCRLSSILVMNWDATSPGSGHDDFLLVDELDLSKVRQDFWIDLISVVIVFKAVFSRSGYTSVSRSKPS